MKHFLINCLIFGALLMFGQFLSQFISAESIKLDMMFLFGVIGCAIVRSLDIYLFNEEEEEDEESNDYI